jgi:cell division protein FtsA
MKDKSFVEKEVNSQSNTMKIVVGLDIGTTKIACFIGRRNEHNKIEIISLGKSESLGVMHGVVANIEKTVQSILSAVTQAQSCEEGSLVIKNVYVGIAGQHIKSMQHRGMYTKRDNKSEITQEDINFFLDDMHKMVMPPGEEIIDVIPQEYIIDGSPEIKDPIGMEGVRLEANFHIITGHFNNVMNIKRCIERADLKVRDIILEPIASADAVLSDEEKEAGVVLVDIGGGTTDIAIFQDSIIRHTAVIPFGGNVITNDIKEGCQIMQRQAEVLKIRFGSASASENKENEVVCIPGLRGRDPKEITLKNLSRIIQARMEEIIELVNYEIKNSGYSKKLIGGIVVTGGGAQLKHLTQLFEYMTGMDTRIGYPTEHLSNLNNIESLSSPMYSTGIGLVLQGFQKIENKQQVQEEQPKDSVSTHSDPRKRGSFFEKLLPSVKEFFTDEH